MKTKILLTAAVVLFLNLLESQAQIWEQTNGPYGGYILSLAVSPSGELFAVVDRGGLYRSTNDGASWFYVGLQNKNVDKVFISTTGIIFISTSYDSIDSYGNIIHVYEPYRSADNGQSWNLVNITIRTVCWTEDQYGNLYVDCWYSGGFNILKSSDGGETWVLWSNHGLGFSTDFLFYDSYIFRSDQANGIYQLINNSWERRFPIQYGGLGTSCIERTPSGVLLAGTFGQGVYRSVDNAATWDRVYSAGIENTDVKAIVVAADGNVYAATENGIFKSTDEGVNWTESGLQNSYVRAMTRTVTNKLIAGNSYGLCRSDSTGTIWEDINVGLYVNRTYSLAYNQTSSTFFAATNTGLFRTTNNGEIWEPVLRAHYGEEYNSNYLNKVPLLVDIFSNLVITCALDMYRSSDDGSTWTSSPYSWQDGIKCLVSGSTPGAILGGGLNSAYFYSSDYGITWTKVLLGDPGGSPILTLSTGDTPEYLYAGTEGNGIYRSADMGSNWRLFNIGLTNTTVHSSVINSTGNIFLATYGGIFRSRDHGGNWRLVGLENDTVLALSSNSVGHIFAGTKKGHVYKSTDDGDTWSDYSSGLNSKEVRSLIVDGHGFAVVGTASGGVYRTTYSTVDINDSYNDIISSFELLQNYPNPFNPSTKIKYSISQSSQVQIKVFDVLGNEIETLVNEEKPAGTYELNWNAAELSSGVYFYQLRAGEFIQSRKMILLK